MAHPEEPDLHIVVTLPKPKESATIVFNSSVATVATSLLRRGTGMRRDRQNDASNGLMRAMPNWKWGVVKASEIMPVDPRVISINDDSRERSNDEMRGKVPRGYAERGAQLDQGFILEKTTTLPMRLHYRKRSIF